MLNINKIYTKNEYLKLRETEDACKFGFWETKSTGEYYDFYVSSRFNVATKKMKILYKEGKLGIFTLMKDYHTLIKIALEAIDRIRAQNDESKYSKKIRAELEVDSNDSQYYKGYWSGVVACIRYISDFNFSVDDLRKTEQLNYILKKRYDAKRVYLYEK